MSNEHGAPRRCGIGYFKNNIIINFGFMPSYSVYLILECRGISNSLGIITNVKCLTLPDFP